LQKIENKNRNQKKKEWKRNKKRRKGLRGPKRPSSRFGPGPASPRAERVRSRRPSPTDARTPPVIAFPWQLSPPRMAPASTVHRRFRATLAPSARKLPTINSPGSPLSSPFDLSRKHQLAAEESLAEPPQVCSHRRSIPSPPVSTSPSLSTYPFYFFLAHLPDHLAWFDSPQIDAIIQHPKHIITGAALAAPLPFLWKQSRTTFMFSMSSRPPATHRSLAVAQKPPERRQRNLARELTLGTLSLFVLIPYVRSRSNGSDRFT
jgi:hypothetical protein